MSLISQLVGPMIIHQYANNINYQLHYYLRQSMILSVLEVMKCDPGSFGIGLRNKYVDVR